jgi:hypothetical protein
MIGAGGITESVNHAIKQDARAFPVHLSAPEKL